MLTNKLLSSTMASSSGTRMKKEERPRFFKVILKDSLTQHKLGIPRKFVHIYGDDLSSPVILKVPGSVKYWRVEIVRSGREIWFQSGWREFAEYYSLVQGSFLVFEYEKNSNTTCECEFNVIIFDKTATEIDYPLNERRAGDLDKEGAPQEPNMKKKMTKLNTSPKTLDGQYFPTGNSREPIEKESNDSTEKESRSKERKLSFSSHGEAKGSGNNFTSANPSFQAKMSLANLRSCVVYVPNSFTKNLKQGTKCATLTFNNRCWSVKLIIQPKLCFGQLSAGWSVFSRDNSLKLGDVCTFQLIDNTDQTPLINVSITRKSGICLVTNGVDREAELRVPMVEETTSEIPDEVSGQFSSSRKRKSPSSSSHPRKKVENFTKNTGQEAKKENGDIVIHRAGSNVQSENTTFQIAMAPSHLYSSWSDLRIPADFARKYIKRNDGVVVLNVMDGKTWTVKYCRKVYDKRRTRTKILHSDWVKFVKGNHLQVGDTCSFKLIDPDKIILGVIISRRQKATEPGELTTDYGV